MVFFGNHFAVYYYQLKNIIMKKTLSIIIIIALGISTYLQAAPIKPIKNAGASKTENAFRTKHPIGKMKKQRALKEVQCPHRP
jgi:hypothetical protein